MEKVWVPGLKPGLWTPAMVVAPPIVPPPVSTHPFSPPSGPAQRLFQASRQKQIPSSSKRDAKGGVPPAAEADLNPWPAPFDKPFHLILNLAVGGLFVGNPDARTLFPAEMVVDYVRVYEKEGGYAEAPPRGEGALPLE